MRLAMCELRSARLILRAQGPSSDTLTQVEKGLMTAIDYLKGNAGPAWPPPLMDEPDLQTLQIWMEDSGCEATVIGWSTMACVHTIILPGCWFWG
jgi:hypothetical protein